MYPPPWATLRECPRSTQRCTPSFNVGWLEGEYLVASGSACLCSLHPSMLKKQKAWKLVMNNNTTGNFFFLLEGMTQLSGRESSLLIINTRALCLRSLLLKDLGSGHLVYTALLFCEWKRHGPGECGVRERFPLQIHRVLSAFTSLLGAFLLASIKWK